jgi:cytochrome c-type biogenesis protein CcmH
MAKSLVRAALLAACLVAPTAWAGEAQPVAANPAIEAQMMEIATELRCVVCQNQTVADSHADLAGDLRQQIRDQLAAGKTPDQVRGFMTDRYGDFVLYKPPFSARTAILWVGPILLLLGGLIGLSAVLRRRARLPDTAFEPDTADDNSPETASSASRP